MKISKKRALVTLGVLFITAAFGYWEYSNVNCTTKARENLIDNGKDLSSILEGKAFFDLNYKICMGRRGF